ncbi:MAG: hypothetical protein LC751_01460, partial [Actinobacteria bacterium]|nr:hypothetical protein [Actinomycetota bacterium]
PYTLVGVVPAAANVERLRSVATLYFLLVCLSDPVVVVERVKEVVVKEVVVPTVISVMIPVIR